ncbi:MAG: hypothetical protein ACFFF9_07845 [Candidatus Thorarchaeota archaeon]
MEKEFEKELIERRIHIVDWPDLERKMGVIARMTSDPPLLQMNGKMDTTSLQSEMETQRRIKQSAR